MLTQRSTFRAVPAFLMSLAAPGLAAAQCPITVEPGTGGSTCQTYVMSWPFTVTQDCLVQWVWRSRCSDDAELVPRDSSFQSYSPGTFVNAIQSLRNCPVGEFWQLEWTVFVGGSEVCSDLRMDLACTPPRFAENPQGTLVCPGGVADVTAPIIGCGRIEWQVELPGMPNEWITIGAATALPCGGMISADQSTSDTPGIRIDPCEGITSYRIRSAVSAACGLEVSPPAVITICRADVNCDGQSDSSDFFAFLDVFFDREPSADFDENGFVDSSDFFAFLAVFFEGCGG